MSKRAGSFLTWQYSLRPSVACLSLGMQSLPAEADGTWIVKGQRSPISTRQPSSTYPGATCSWCLLDPRACHTQTHVMKNSHFLFSCHLCVSLLFFNEKLSLSEKSSVTHTFPICAAYSSENVSPNWKICARELAVRVCFVSESHCTALLSQQWMLVSFKLVIFIISLHKTAPACQRRQRSCRAAVWLVYSKVYDVKKPCSDCCCELALYN